MLHTPFIRALGRLEYRRPFVVFLLTLICFALTPCQDAFVPIPSPEAARYHIDFARNFFTSPEAEKADRANLYATLKELESLKGLVGSSAENLARALELNDRVQILLRRHYAYLYLRNAVNTLDEASLGESSALSADVSARTAFVQQELMQLNDRQLTAFITRRPSLKAYLFEIESARRYRPYTLSLKEEELLSATALNNDWVAELYDELRTQSQPTQLQRDLFAFTLTRLAATRTRLARLHEYPDAASEIYFNSYWSKAEVDDLLEQIAQKADLFKRYQRMRAAYVKSAKDTPFTPPRYSIDEASEIIRNAITPLGAEYGRELAALLDPANGRMDIVPGEHRKRGGFSQGFIGTDSVFYSAGFAGSYNDLRVLTHESTHAVHRQLMNRNRVLPPYAEGPHYLFEAFAIFNEFLLPDYLYQHETDPYRRQFYLERFLEGKGMEMFRVAPEVVLEHAVYEGVANGKIKTAGDLEALSQRTYARYWTAENDDQFKSEWEKITLMYEDPFYDINYVYGSLLALNFYAMYLRDPEHFVPRYIALMKNGFDAPPEILLKRFLDLDLRDPRVLSNALSVIEDKVNLLEKSYQR
jgi:oligoendopeptidase F